MTTLTRTLSTAAVTALAAMALTTPAVAAEWTDWLDRDGPSGSGDWELTGDHYAEGTAPCDDPIDFEARRKSDGVDASETGEVVHLSLAGFRCIRSEQPDNACADYEVRMLCPAAGDGAWSDWINQDSPNGSGDYERANANYAGGNIDCLVPTAIETRRISDQLDMTRTGESYSFWTDYPYGFTCYNDNQPDGVCDDYETRYFCASESYTPPPYGDADGEIDLGDFLVVYNPDDLSLEADGYYYIDEGFELWFGSVWLNFSAGDLKLDLVDGEFQIVEFVIAALPTSNLPLFGVMALPDGFDILAGYGSGGLLDDLDAPLNPDYAYFFLSIAAGSAEFGDLTVSAPVSFSATLAIAPDPVTVYTNLGGFFPPMGPVTIGEIGIGFSVADGLLWQPTTTWGFTHEMVDQTGNLWLDGSVGLGIHDALSLDFAGEVLGDVDFDAVADGDDGLNTLAFNGAVSLVVGPDFLQITQDIASMSVLYTAANNRWIASAESADLSDGMQGVMQWLDLSATAKLAVAIQDDELKSLVIQGDVSILDTYSLGNAEIAYDGDTDTATFEGTLDLLTSDLSVTGTIDDSGFSLSGSSYATVASGFYKVRAIATVTQSGLGVSLGVSAWDFATASYGSYTNISGGYTVADGWCANIGGVLVCLAPGGGLTIGGTYAEDIDAAVKESWSVVSGAVVDGANAVVEDVVDRIADLIAGRCWLQNQCASDKWCYVPTGACKDKLDSGEFCGTGVECNSGTCINVCAFLVCAGVCT